MIFKIYGERNSGTNFLTKLLKLNFGDNLVFSDHIDLNTSIIYYWKHGYPDKNFKESDDLVIDIFIVRSLEKWIISMFNNPYCLDFGNKKRSFEYFLNQKHSIETINGLTLKNQNKLKIYAKFIHYLMFRKTGTKEILNQNLAKHLNKLINKHRSSIIEPTEYFREHKNLLPMNFVDEGRNIFEIRYAKLDSYFSYMKSNNDSLIISLDTIQNDGNCLKFLEFLNKNYKLGNENFELINKNLKTYSNQKNTIYSTDISLYKPLINKLKNHSVESFINNLSWSFNA